MIRSLKKRIINKLPGLLAVNLIFTQFICGLPRQKFIFTRLSLPAMTQQSKVSSNFKIKQNHPVINEGKQMTLSAIDNNGKTLDNVNWLSGSPDIAQIDSQSGV